MRSRLVKESLLSLPSANQGLMPKSKPRTHQFGFPPAARGFVVALLAFLGLSLAIYSGLHQFWHSRHSAAANSVLSRFTSKPPLVDRTILEKIASLDSEDEINSNSGTGFSIPIDIKSPSTVSPFHQLPRVTRIPEMKPQAPQNLEMETQTRFCSEKNGDHGPQPCKFLLPLKIVEQGTNAHLHLAQLLELARALNRTLVLPNVGKNKMGACLRWRFGVYYDEQALSNNSGGDPNPVIQQDRFRTWVNSLASPPSSQLVLLGQSYPKSFLPTVNAQADSGLGIYTYDDSITTESILYSQTGCLNRKFPRLDLAGPFPPLSFVVGDHHERESNGNGVSQTLLEKLSEPVLARNSFGKTHDHSTDYDSSQARVSPDILVVSWNVSIAIFQPRPTAILRYSPQLRALASRLARRLGPYVAIAWDVETSEVDAVLGCVEALRSTLHYVLTSYGQLGVRNIWLAGNLSPSDLVYSSGHPRAGTPTEKSFFTFDVKLTGVHQELEGMVQEGEEVDDLAHNRDEVARKQELLRDAGILGIIDKLVSRRSATFITASKSCGRMSTFTRAVIDWRRASAEKNFAGNLGIGGDAVLGGTDGVVTDSGVVEFG